MNAQSIGAVGCYLDIDHRIIKTQGHHSRCAHRPVTLHFNNAVMLFRKQKLAFRTHHGLAFLAANGAQLQSIFGGGDHCTRQCDNGFHTSPCIGRTADHLLNALISFNLAQPQLIRVGMLLSFKNISHFERGEFLGAVADFFNFQPNAHQAIKDLLQGRRSVEMLFEPGESEFHFMILSGRAMCLLWFRV